MYLISTLNIQEEVLEVLNKIQSCNEPGVAGKLHLFSLISLNFKYIN